MPLPMKRTANRFGNVFDVSVVAPRAGSDSSHGNAIATPAPRRTARLDMLIEGTLSSVVHENHDNTRTPFGKLRASACGEARRTMISWLRVFRGVRVTSRGGITTAPPAGTSCR